MRVRRQERRAGQERWASLDHLDNSSFALLGEVAVGELKASAIRRMRSKLGRARSAPQMTRESGRVEIDELGQLSLAGPRLDEKDSHFLVEQSMGRAPPDIETRYLAAGWTGWYIGYDHYQSNAYPHIRMLLGWLAFGRRTRASAPWVALGRRSTRPSWAVLAGRATLLRCSTRRRKDPLGGGRSRPP